MELRLHKNARTTPAARTEIAASAEGVSALARRYGLGRRHGVGNPRDPLPKEAKAPVKVFKDYAPGFLHMDVKYLPQMEDETKRRYLFVAIDRATRWVYLEVKEDKTARGARTF
ncbi:MAG: hypothetical protein LBU11_08500, partial [Zoogloeaceae bacterium]|nr:hypothetical protein [Zoogloeaceae bacterium]